MLASVSMVILSFQSTLPAWGATIGGGAMNAAELISIHAPRMGSDRHAINVFQAIKRFQSTLPAWGATDAVNE